MKTLSKCGVVALVMAFGSTQSTNAQDADTADGLSGHPDPHTWFYAQAVEAYTLCTSSQPYEIRKASSEVLLQASKGLIPSIPYRAADKSLDPDDMLQTHRMIIECQNGLLADQ